MFIHYAARTGDLHSLAREIERGVSVDARDPLTNLTPLMVAAGTSSAPLASLTYLLQRGARVNEVGGPMNGFTPLTQAIGAGSLPKVRQLLSSGADPRYCTGSGFSPLMAAASCDACIATEMVDIFIERGADVNHQDRNGWTAATQAVSAGNFPLAMRLRDLGASIAALRWTSLQAAIAFGTVDEVEALAPAFDVALSDDGFGMSPLVLAAFVGEPAKLAIMLSSPNSEQGAMQEALTVATQYDRARCAELLLDYGVDPNAWWADGETALTTAVAHEARQCVQLLRTRGVNVNGKNEDGTPPLSTAWTAEMAELLLDWGAAIDVVDEMGYSPLSSAAHRGLEEVVAVLIGRGAAMELDALHEQALHCAVSADQLGVVELLLAAGADPQRGDEDGWIPARFAKSDEVAQAVARR